MEVNENEAPSRQIALFLLTVGIFILCALVLYRFFTAIVGAIVLAVIMQKPCDWLRTKIGNSSVRASILLTIVVLAFIIPGFFLAQSLGEQALAAVTVLRSNAAQQRFSEFIGSHPALASRIQSISDSVDLNNATRTIAAYLGGKLAGFLGNSFRWVTQVVVMLFILFFLFRDRTVALNYLRSILPLRDHETTELLTRVGDTIYATSLGRLAIAGVQGLFAGLAFWFLGVPGVVLWACTTVVASMIPAFGSFLVWGPVSIYLGLSGHWGKAAILAVWGGIIVSTIDNILYPFLVGSRLRSNTALILVSILGGIAFFGPTGIILGPVTFTLADTLLTFWRARTGETQPILR